jgi:hypothetical protein
LTGRPCCAAVCCTSGAHALASFDMPQAPTHMHTHRHIPQPRARCRGARLRRSA